MSTATERATFTLPSQTLRGLKAFARSECRSRSNVVAIALEWFLAAAECKRLHELEPAAIPQGTAAERPVEHAGEGL
ncbi:MAG TPA: hypothetical protein VGR92_06085 [Steroidobacteraceae bacterium]|nr:hypothetical protein [Steroidobacteraceae bacterium]